MTISVQWETPRQSEHYYDTLRCYVNACTTLAKLYMQTGDFGKIKAVYQYLLERPVLSFSDEQVSAFRTIIEKLQKVEPDNSIFTRTATGPSQMVESPIAKPSETPPRYLVSAIVLAYNSEKYIRGCLEALENQAIADKLEIIVVDSGSQQNEAAVVREFQQRYNNIKYIRTGARQYIAPGTGPLRPPPASILLTPTRMTAITMMPSNRLLMPSRKTQIKLLPTAISILYLKLMER